MSQNENNLLNNNQTIRENPIITSDILHIDLIPGNVMSFLEEDSLSTDPRKKEVHLGDNISDSIIFAIRYSNSFLEKAGDMEDVRQNKSSNYLLILSCNYELKPSNKFNKEDFSKYVHEFDKYREENKEDMDFRYLYDGFSVPVFKFDILNNIDTDPRREPTLNLPPNIRLLLTKEGIEMLLYVFVYTLSFGYNYISLGDVIDYEIASGIEFYGYTKDFFDNVKNSVNSIKDNYSFLKDYMDNLKTEISLFDYIKNNIKEYYNTALEDQRNAISQRPYNRKQKFIFNESDAIIYLLGDIEGDYLMILNWFIDNGFIDKTLKWIAPKNYYVIQCGDQLDKNNPALNNPKGGPNKVGFFRRERGQSIRKPDVNVILLFDYLYYESKAHVLSVIGNHDFASLQQDYRYVSNQDLVYRERLGLFNRDNLLYNVVLSRPFIILFNNLTISHAGLTDKIISKYIKIKTEDLVSRQSLVQRGLIENTQSVEIDLTMFVNEINNFNFYNKDLSNPEIWKNNKAPENSIYRNILFYQVINELIWNRDYKDNSCGEVRPLKLNKSSDELTQTITVIGHNPYENVNYCSKKTERGYKLFVGGTRDLNTVSTIKVDTGLSSRKCKTNEDGSVSIINYAVIDTLKEIVETKQYYYDCDPKNKKKFKFDINLIEMITLAMIENPYDLF